MKSKKEKIKELEKPLNKALKEKDLEKALKIVGKACDINDNK